MTPSRGLVALPLVALVVLLSGSSPVHTLPHGIPHLCASVPDRTVIAPGTPHTLTNVDVSCVEVHGTLTIVGRVTADTILVYPGAQFTQQNGSEIIWRDTPIDTVNDPEQWGGGLVCLGACTAIGTAKTEYARLAGEVPVGSTTLTLAVSPSGWLSGDRLVLPDTRQIERNWGNPAPPVWQGEIVTVASVSGSVVSLQAPTQFAHAPSREEDGSVFRYGHVANLTRSIVMRSANPNGTRAHALFTDRADVNIQHVEFRDMGRTTNAPLDCTLRSSGSVQGPGPNPGATHTCVMGSGDVTHVGTNQIGRYPLHVHMLTGPVSPQANGRQFTLIGNVVTGSPKWGIAIHASHYGLVADNVIYDVEGAGLMTEDGSETGNVIEHNYVVKVWGTGGRMGGGREGVGFYFRGPNNLVRDNIAANLYADGPDAAFGFKYFFTYLGTIHVPTAQGATTTIARDGNALPLTEFARNEVYASDNGLTYWWIGSRDTNPVTTERSVIDGLTAWHFNGRGVFNYPSANVTLKDVELVMDPTWRAVVGIGIEGGDYLAHEWQILNPRIRYTSQGITPSTSHGGAPQRIVGGEIVSTQGIIARTLNTSGYRADQIPPRLATIDGTRFRIPIESNPIWLNGVRGWLVYDYATTGVRNFVQRDEITVTDLNGVSGDTFRWFYPQQTPDFVVPVTVLNSDGTAAQLGSPVAGLTNAQALAQHGVAMAGSITPCLTMRANVTGFTCGSTVTPPPPPPPPVNCTVSEWSEWSAWTPIDATTEVRTRTRTILTPASHGGTCTDALVETETRPIVIVLPPVNVCEADPLRVTKVTWPSVESGARQLRYTASHRIESVTLDQVLTRGTWTDTRGCVAVVFR